ncbi:DUF1330 domain-containing protein [Vibrio owensii]
MLRWKSLTPVCISKAAHAWHDSPEYAPLRKLRDEKAMRDLKIIPVPAV